MAERQQDNLREGRPRNAGLPWTDSQKQELLSRYQGGESPTRLAEGFERSASSVLSQLLRLDALTQEEAIRIARENNLSVPHAAR